MCLFYYCIIITLDLFYIINIIVINIIIINIIFVIVKARE